MADRTCSVDGCGRTVIARGWCKTHYRRWRIYGNPLAGKFYRGRNATCTVEDCGRPHKGHGLCEPHLDRMKRHGSLELPPPRVCAVADCTRRHVAQDYCRLHYKRFLAHGDPNTVLREMNYGEDIGYEAVHARLTKRRGRAANRLCVDCGVQAQDWSYDNADPGERVAPNGLRFSTNLDHYEPRCKSCHKAFDLEQARA